MTTGSPTNTVIRPRSQGVLSTLVDAGLELIDDGGVDQVTVRALAKRTHYSASTVGYHTTPMRRFVTTLWHEVGGHLLEASIPQRGDGHWSERSARQMLQWAERNPRRTEFFVTFEPERQLPIDIRVFDQLGIREAARDERMADTVMFLVRRLQASLEFAIAAPSQQEAVGILGPAIHHDWRFWRSRRTSRRTSLR